MKDGIIFTYMASSQHVQNRICFSFPLVQFFLFESHHNLTATSNEANATMAFLKAISVSIELFDNGSWRTLEEFEMEDTLREVANCVTRCTSAIQTRPGFFRFRVVAAQSFNWGDANALKMVLTLDEGATVNQYETLALQPGGEDVRQLAADLRLDPNVIMHTSRSNAAIYYLDSIWMPLEHTGVEKWIRAEFAFEKLYSDQDSKLILRDVLSNTRHGRIRIDIVPCQISPDRGRSRILNPYEHRSGQLSNLLLGTCFHWDPETEVDGKYYYKMQSVTDHQTFSFIFLYSEVSRSRAIPPEMIDYIDVGLQSKETGQKGATPQSLSNLGPRSYLLRNSELELHRTDPSANHKEKLQLQVDSKARSTVWSTPDPEIRNDLPRGDNCENRVQKIMDPNLANRTVSVHHIQATSKKELVLENHLSQDADNQPQTSISTPLLQQMRMDLTSLEDTHRQIQAAKARVFLQIKLEKAQRSQELQQIERDIDETEKLLSELQVQKDQLLNDEKDLNVREAEIDTGTDGDRDLAVASQAMRRYQAQQLQLLRNIETSVPRKRRRSQLSSSPVDHDTIVVSSPAP